MCCFLVDATCQMLTPESWEKELEACPKMLTDSPNLCRLVLKQFSKKAQHDPSAQAPLDVCDYHDHKDGDERNACKAKKAV